MTIEWEARDSDTQTPILVTALLDGNQNLQVVKTQPLYPGNVWGEESVHK